MKTNSVAETNSPLWRAAKKSSLLQHRQPWPRIYTATTWKLALLPEVDKRYRQLLRGSKGSRLPKSQSPPCATCPSLAPKPPSQSAPAADSKTTASTCQLTPQSPQRIDETSFWQHSQQPEHRLKKCNSQTLTTRISWTGVKEENQEDSDDDHSRLRTTKMQYLEEEVRYLRERFLAHYQRRRCAAIDESILHHQQTHQSHPTAQRPDRLKLLNINSL